MQVLQVQGTLVAQGGGPCSSRPPTLSSPLCPMGCLGVPWDAWVAQESSSGRGAPQRHVLPAVLYWCWPPHVFKKWYMQPI